MGSGRWDSDSWKTYATSRSYDTKKVEEIFARSMDPSLDPKGVLIRESRDSDDNANSNALIIALDVTGSMGMVLDVMAKTGLNTLVTEIHNRKPVADPHIMAMGIGDVEAGDRAPLQVTQFEADLRIAEQLEKIFLEKGGGGNHYESYALAWYFAAMHTSIDCFEKRNKKGYIFTIGDEKPTPYLRKQDIERVLGTSPQSDLNIKEILSLASRQWEIFHLIVEEGSYARSHRDLVINAWQDLLGQNALLLPDHTKLGEVIVSTLQICEGADKDHVVDSWDGSTAVAVREATRSLTKTNKESAVVSL